MKHLIIVSIWAGFTLLFSMWSHAEIYKWTDAQGVTHYGDQKPLDRAAQKLDIKTQKVPSVPSRAPVERAKQLEKDKEEALEEKAKRLKASQGAAALAERCEQTRQALKNYEDRHRILDGTGDEPRVLDYETKQRKIAEFKQILAEECGG